MRCRGHPLHSSASKLSRLVDGRGLEASTRPSGSGTVGPCTTGAIVRGQCRSSRVADRADRLDLVSSPRSPRSGRYGAHRRAAPAATRAGRISHRRSDRGHQHLQYRSTAAGEVRISGVIEPAEVVLVSALQSARCVYYRAIGRRRRRLRRRGGLPRGALGRVPRSGRNRIHPDLPARRAVRCAASLRGRTDLCWGRTGPGSTFVMDSAIDVGEPDREALIAELLGRRPSLDTMAGGTSDIPAPRPTRPAPLSRDAPGAGRPVTSSASRCRSATCRTRPAPTLAQDLTCRSQTRRSPRTSPRLAPPERSWTTRKRRGAMPPSRVSGSAAQ